MTKLIFYGIFILGLLIGLGFDLWLYIHDKHKYKEPPPQSILMLTFLGSGFVSIIMAAIVTTIVERAFLP